MVLTNGAFYQFECVGIFASGQMRLLTIEVERTETTEPAPTGRFEGYVWSAFGSRLEPGDGPTMFRTVEQGDERWSVWGITSTDTPCPDDCDKANRAAADDSSTLQCLMAGTYGKKLAPCTPAAIEVATALLCGAVTQSD